MWCRISVAGVIAAIVLPFPSRAETPWADFADETAARLVLNSDTPQTPGMPDDLPIGDNWKVDIAWGDVNHDGLDDCVLVYAPTSPDRGTHRNWLFINESGVLVDRTAEWASESDVLDDEGFLTPTSDSDVVIVDVNGDGWNDIITVVTRGGTLDGEIGLKHDSHPRIYINQQDDERGWQGFVYDDVDRVPTLPAEPRFSEAAVGDVDNDGDVDLFFVDQEQGGARPVDVNDRLWINDGNGYFSDESEERLQPTMIESTFAPTAVIADINGDGHNDIVKGEVSQHPTSIEIYFNNLGNEAAADGFFNVAQSVGSAGAYDLSVADLNNDQIGDLVATFETFNRFYLNAGVAPYFTSPSLFDGDQSRFVGHNVVADFNGDGWRDVFICSAQLDPTICEERGQMYRNSGGEVGGAIELAYDGDVGIALEAYMGTYDVATPDIDADGRPDLIIGSCNGTWVYLNKRIPMLDISYPNGIVELIDPGTGSELVVQATPDAETSAAVNAVLWLSINAGPYEAIPMVSQGDGVFSVDLPAGACNDRYEYYLEVETSADGVFLDPQDAPINTFSTVVSYGLQTVAADSFETDAAGWTVLNDPALETGAWEQGVPAPTISGGELAAPDGDGEDALHARRAFITQNCPTSMLCPAADYDVDGGPTHLVSPSIDLFGSGGRVFYQRWFYCSGAGTPDADFLTVWVSADDGQNWILVDTVATTEQTWERATIDLSEFVGPVDTIRVRFSVADMAGPSITEAGIDAFRVERHACSTCDACDDGAECTADYCLAGACQSNNVAIVCLDGGVCYDGTCIGPCTEHELCADMNGDGIRDDNCRWWTCNEGVCESTAIVFADMGGQFGACPPDGTSDGNDRFIALNCFANQNANGSSPNNCETDAPAAFNVDAGGPFGDCNPDGICDANDAFHALNSFEGMSPCSCSPGPMPVFEPVVTVHATLELRPNKKSVRPGDTIAVEVYLSSPLMDLRGYQLHLGVAGGAGGRLELVDISVDERRDAVFANQTAWTAFNQKTGQVLAGLDAPGIRAEAGAYMATFTYRGSREAVGPFRIEVLQDGLDTSQRTFLFATDPQVVMEIAGDVAVVDVVEGTPRRAGR